MPGKDWNPLAQIVDDCLIANMPPGLRAAVLAALNRGSPPGDVISRVRQVTGGLTYLAVEALVARWLREHPDRN